MKITKEERLKVYKKMLKDYTFPRIFRNEFTDPTRAGFCCYITNKMDDDDDEKYYYLSDFPELCSQEPKERYGLGFWFKPGRKLPRIYCIIKALILCKNGKDKSGE